MEFGRNWLIGFYCSGNVMILCIYIYVFVYISGCECSGLDGQGWWLCSCKQGSLSLCGTKPQE